MKTRDRILQAALDLFNDKGTACVTTHHIADACGISPGNLYYHFRNKSEIIRALFQKSLAENQTQSENDQPANYRDGVEAGISFAKDYSWRYRFLKHELPQLLRQDEILRSQFHELHRKQLLATRTAIDQAIEIKGIKPLHEREKDYLAELSWLVALFWPSLIEVGGEEPTRENLDRGMDIIRWLFTGPLALSKEQTPVEEK